MSDNEIINNDKENNLVIKEDIEEQDKIEQMEKDEIDEKIEFKYKLIYVFKAIGAIISSFINSSKSSLVYFLNSNFSFNFLSILPMEFLVNFGFIYTSNDLE